MKTRIIKSKLPALMLFTLLLIVACPAKAQVTIGSGIKPNSDALLDLNQGVGDNGNESDKGLLLPRVALVRTADPTPLANDVEGMYVYNTATANDVTPGIYYNDGEKWVRSGGVDWFYLPSFNLDLSVAAPGEEKTINLYDDVYAKQFTKAGNANFVAPATGLPAGFTFDTATNKLLYTKDQLVFVVTDYDNTVIKVNTVGTDGEMSYTVLSTTPPAGSYINIICVVKQ